ncbi:hypothetical protein [Aliiroseovarius crassostreae]|uniref:hypothetical protein n=2 Tax=Aliiroseovarius crassostreae TaxID=154981 RepID=UPI00158792BE|nr:hypothetical protein [Aliiroseovarius crassostreae]
MYLTGKPLQTHPVRQMQIPLISAFEVGKPPHGPVFCRKNADGPSKGLFINNPFAPIVGTTKRREALPRAKSTFWGDIHDPVGTDPENRG